MGVEKYRREQQEPSTDPINILLSAI